MFSLLLIIIDFITLQDNSIYFFKEKQPIIYLMYKLFFIKWKIIGFYAFIILSYPFFKFKIN